MGKEEDGYPKSEALKKEGYKKVYWRRRETRFSNGGEGIQERFNGEEEILVQVSTMWEERSKKGTVGGSGGGIRIGQWRRRDIRKGQEEDIYTRM